MRHMDVLPFSLHEVQGSVSGMTNEQEVQVHTRGPGRGNPSLKRQVRCRGVPRIRQWNAVGVREGTCGRSHRCVHLMNV